MKDPYDHLWLHRNGIGIKIFNRVGSGTMTREYFRSQSYEEFMKCDRKMCVVRDPFARLLSVWNGLWPGGSMPGRGYPNSIRSFEHLMQYVIKQDPRNLELHTRPMWAQLEDLWEPKDHELMTMEDFFADPPFGLKKADQHHHKSPVVPKVTLGDVKIGQFYQWLKWAEKDIALFQRAKKPPCDRGQATADDGHEKR